MSILAAELPGVRVLDLFAGSGALGLEALSRGAAAADFVELHRASLAAAAGSAGAASHGVRLCAGGDERALERRSSTHGPSHGAASARHMPMYSSAYSAPGPQTST